MKFLTLTANFSGVTRNDTMEGKDFLVVPMIMMVEGVLVGSQGAMYYPVEELAKVPEVWNTKPVVVYHPEKDGQGISACDPDILTNRKVGVIMNTIFEDGKLKAEAWLDPLRVNLIDERILEAIAANQIMELSTGLFTDTEDTSGEFDGKHYDCIARNYRPDHLALLPDIKGACSVEDGAGFLRLNAEKNAVEIDITAMAGEQVKEYFEANKERILKKMKSIIYNELSHADIRSALANIIRGDSDDGWIEDVFDDTFVYEKGGTLYEQSYSVKEDKVSVSGLPVAVIRVTSYEPIGVSNMQVNNVSNVKGKAMNKEQKIDALIANKDTKWTEADKPFLMLQDEEVVDKMEPEKETAAEAAGGDGDEAAVSEAAVSEAAGDGDDAAGSEKTTTNKKPKTVEQYIQDAPAGIQEVLRNGLKSHDALKARLIKLITANAQNIFSAEQLKDKTLDELKGLGALARNADDQSRSTDTDFSAQEEIITENDEEPLEVPVINFEKAKASA